MYCSKNCLIALFSIIILLLADTSYSNQIVYENKSYLFSFIYDDYNIEKVYEDKPPLPQHGIKIQYINGDIMYVTAFFLTRFTGKASYEEIEELDKYVSECKKITNNSFFSIYYMCANEFVAYKNVKIDDADILYEIFYNTKDSENVKYFNEIIKTFHITNNFLE